MDLMDLFDETDHRKGEHKPVHAPFGWPGGKTRTAHKIAEHLPYRGSYIEPFGGSGAVLLYRKPSKLEVFNDRYAGVVAFYRCIRDKNKMDKLCEWLECTVHSREEFLESRDTWEDVNDDIERAGRWLYITKYSFSAQRRHFGRATSIKATLGGRLTTLIPNLIEVHERIKMVTFENLDWRSILRDYDNDDAVFYLDPPYIETYNEGYTHDLTHADHRALIDTVFSMQAFVAISGYPNPVYTNQDWDNIIEYDAFVSYDKRVREEDKGKSRTIVKECLYIKEAE